MKIIILYRRIKDFFKGHILFKGPKRVTEEVLA